MAYEVRVLPGALHRLKRVPRKMRDRIRDRIDRLGADPRPPDAKPLKGIRGVWRIPVGDYRVCFTVKDDILTVVVVLAMHRRDVYRVLLKGKLK